MMAHFLSRTESTQQTSSGAGSKYTQQNCLKTKESETFRSVASKLQS